MCFCSQLIDTERYTTSLANAIQAKKVAYLTADEDLAPFGFKVHCLSVDQPVLPKIESDTCCCCHAVKGRHQNPSGYHRDRHRRQVSLFDPESSFCN